MIDLNTYIQSNEPINGENGAPGEVDVANRPLKELVQLLNDGEANTQVRRINFKIEGAQEIGDGVTSDDVVFFNNSTNKYEKVNWNSKNALGIIDVENLIIYSFGEYTLKNINNLLPGRSYSISRAADGAIVPETDTVNSSFNIIGIAINSNTIEINKYIDSVFDSVTIDDVNISNSTVWSSQNTNIELTNRSTKVFILIQEILINHFLQLKH